MLRNTKVTLFSAAALALGFLFHSAAFAAPAAPMDTVGLVGYWDFENDPGDTVRDASGHGLNGFPTGAAESGPGVQGKAMIFDGGTRVTIPYTPAMALKEWTVMCWVRTKDRGDHQSLISRQPPLGSPIDFRLHLSGSIGDGWNTPPGRVVPGYWNSSVPESTFAVGRTDVRDGAWHLVAGVYKPGQLLVYVDGRPDGSRIAPAAPLANDLEPLTLGASNYRNGSYFLIGGLDEVRIYDHAWSDARIASDYDRYSPPVLPAQDLIAHYDFDRSSGSVLPDKSGNGHDGAVSGAVWTQGVNGNALRFDGIDDQVLVPFAEDLNTPEYTLEAWIRTDEKTHDQAVIDRVEPSGSRWNYRLMIPSRIQQIEGHSVEPGVVQSDVRNTFTSRWDFIALGRTKVTLGHWRHVAATFRNRVFNIYVDGVLDGTKTVPIDAVIDSRQPLLLGNCPFPQLEFHFRGDMDEVKLWRRALTGAEIAASAGKFLRKAPEVNLGMKSYYANAGDTLWVPLYLANYEADSLSAMQFTLQSNPAVVTLLDVKKDSGLAAGWPLFDWARSGPEDVPVALGGAPVPLGYGEGELVRFKFLVRPDAAPGATTALELTRVKLDENGTIRVTNLPGHITVFKPRIVYGDVTGNGEVDIFDAHRILELLVGKYTLPNPDYPAFTLESADVSGNGEITSYDAALVFQYGIGLIGMFPVQKPKAAASGSALPLAKSSAGAGAVLTAEAVKLGDDSFRYRIKGRNLHGMVGGELAFEVGDEVVDFGAFASGVPGARINRIFKPSDRSLGVILTTPDDIDEDEVVLLDIVTQQKPGVSGSGLTLVSAYLDEGRLTGSGIVAKPLVPTRILHKAAARTARFLTASGGELRILAAAGKPLRIEAFGLDGRKILSRGWASAPDKVALRRDELPEGMVWIRATIDGVPHSGSVVNMRAR